MWRVMWGILTILFLIALVSKADSVTHITYILVREKISLHLGGGY